MYEFSDEGQSFKVDDLDLIMCTRLSKNKDENKFIYLYNAFCSIDNHLWAKRKENHGKIQEIKNYTTRFFVMCLQSPDIFELPNETR